MNSLHPSARRVRLLALGLAGLLLSTAVAAQKAVLPPDPALQAMNVMRLGDRLITAGQPDRQSLATLREREGVQAVIYLAPSTARDAVAEEPALLAAQGIEFVHIPIPWEAPTAEHAQAFRAAMNRLRDRKVLVHCQANMRASALTFLWRVLDGGVPLAEAHADLKRIWTPDGPWRAVVDAQLKPAGLALP